MKQLRLVFALLIISAGALAQEQKSAVRRSPTAVDNLIAGASGALIYSPDGRSLPARQSQAWGISRRFGYFIVENFVAGAEITITNQYGDPATHAKYHNKVGAFVRYYAGRAMAKNGTAKKLRFFGEVGLAYGQVGFLNLDYFDSYDMIDLRIVPGMTYMVRPRIGLEVALNGTFEFLSYRDVPEVIYSPSVGIQFFISGGKRAGVR